MKKKLLLAAMISVALIGCSKDQMVTEGGEAIGFNTITTRADETTTANLKDFQVWAYYSTSTTHAYNSTEFMNVTASRGTAAGTTGYCQFTYSPLKFWQSTGYLDFFAVSPASAYAAPALTGTATDITMTYSVTDADAPKHVDLMFAQHL